jgi:hypothetical protein
MPVSHENSPWGTPHAGTNGLEELSRQLNLMQMQQQQQHMAHQVDSALGALSLSQQLHQHHQPGWGGPGNFRDTFKPASWSAGRPQRDKAGRWAAQE